MKKSVLIIFIILTGFTVPQIFAQTNTTHYIMQDTIQRSFIVHLPAGYNASSPSSCVFNLHGSGMSAQQQMVYSKMNPVSDANNFIVVYPNGIDNSWLVGFVDSYYENNRDVLFIEAVLDTLEVLYNIDPDRIYTCGISQGGYMSHKLVCDLQNRFAAVASVAGGIADSVMVYCDDSRSVPALLMHGTADIFVPYTWAEEAITFWVTNNSCAPFADTINITDINVNDNSTVQHIVYNFCDNGSTVEIFKIYGGGHTWPDGFMALPGYGNTNYDINASLEIWKFFNRYTLHGATLDFDKETTSSSISIFPNPAKNEIRIEGVSLPFNVRIIHVNGSQAAEINGGNNIDISELPSGFYYLQIENESSLTIKKLIKE